MKQEETETTEAVPVCEKCGNALIKESFDSAQDSFLDKSKKLKRGEWMCPHCQGEIDFFGDSPS